MRRLLIGLAVAAALVTLVQPAAARNPLTYTAQSLKSLKYQNGCESLEAWPEKLER